MDDDAGELQRPMKRLKTNAVHSYAASLPGPAPVVPEANPLGRGDPANQPAVEFVSSVLAFVGSRDWFLWGSLAALVLYAGLSASSSA